MIKLVFEVRKNDKIISKEKFTQPVIKVGDLKSSHLRLDDGSVSRMHCVIEATPDGISVIDLGSSRGTLLNGVKVNKATLKQHDVLTLGNYTLGLVLVKSVEDKEPETTSALLGSIFEKAGLDNVRQVEVEAAFLNLDKLAAFKAVVHRVANEPAFRTLIETLTGSLERAKKRAKGDDSPKDEADDLLGDLDDYADMLSNLCALAEGLKGKFDIPRATKAIDELFDELAPLDELIKKRGAEFRDTFRGVFDEQLQHACLLRAKLVKDMMDVGITEDHAFEIMTKSWGAIIESALKGVAQVHEMSNKKS